MVESPDDVKRYLRLNFKTGEKTFYGRPFQVPDLADRAIFQELTDNPVLIIDGKQYGNEDYIMR